jgi:hypothetical protein
MKPRAALAAAAIAVLMVTSGCGSEDRQEQHTVIAVDLTGSFSDAEVDTFLNQRVDAATKALNGTGSVSVFGFKSKVGTSKCIPPEATVTWDGNTTKFNDQIRVASAQLKAAAADHLECVRKENADKKRSSDILGAMAQSRAMIGDSPGERKVVIISDGCQTTYDIRTCKNTKIVKDAYRASILKSLPKSLTPDFTGVSLAFAGLAVNSEMDQTGVTALKSFYQEYGKLVGASSVEFE